MNLTFVGTVRQNNSLTNSCTWVRYSIQHNSNYRYINNTLLIQHLIYEDETCMFMLAWMVVCSVNHKITYMLSSRNVMFSFIFFQCCHSYSYLGMQTVMSNATCPPWRNHILLWHHLCKQMPWNYHASHLKQITVSLFLSQKADRNDRPKSV